MFKNYIYYVILCVPTIRPFLLVFREIEGHNQGHGLRRKNLLNALSTIIDLMQTSWPDNDLIYQYFYLSSWLKRILIIIFVISGLKGFLRNLHITQNTKPFGFLIGIFQEFRKPHCYFTRLNLRKMGPF